MMLTGVPRITQDEDTFQLAMSLQTLVTDIVCDIARAIVAGEDDKAFNALDDVGTTLEAIDLDDTEQFSRETLAQQLFDRLDTAMKTLALDTEIRMGPATARQLGLRLIAFADSALARA